MGVQVKLKSLMQTFKYSIQFVHERTGLSRSTISLLCDNKVCRIDFSSISKLCKLFHCEVGDILHYIPEKKGEQI